jgi:hypothetical protein
MLSFLKAGDIYGAIRQITNLPGLSFHADGDKIKYALLNHSMAMRANLSGGAPIFNNIRQWEADIEKRDIACMMSGDLPSMAANAAAATARSSSLFATDNDLRIDNAALAFIMAKELTFLNRAIQMISLMATRYQEEEEDAQWGCSPKCDSYDDDIVSSEEPPSPHSLQTNEDLESATGGDGLRLLRSQSHDYPYTAASASAPASASASERTQKPTNQLVSTFLIASGRLMTRFIGLCKFTGTDIVLVNAMTTRDSPHSSEANHAKQFRAQSNVVSDIYLHYTKYDAEHRDPVVATFLELRDISASTWKVMSLFACSNLFRLTAGTDFARYDDPEDAIFTQSRVHVHSLVAPRKPGEILFSCAAAEAEAAEAAETEAVEAEAEAVEAEAVEAEAVEAEAE